MLLLGLILCCGSAVVHALKPNLVVCSVARIASGTSYAIVYATLLVKLGQAHDMFSRIFRIRIYELFSTKYYVIFILIFSKMLKTEKKTFLTNKKYQ